MSDNKRLIICLTGMPGAGKSSVASFLKEKGFEVVTMGDIVREEAKRQGLEPTDINLGKMMLKLRQDLGPGAVGYIVLQKLARDSSSSNVVIDGIRSIAEVEVLKNVGHVRLLAIHASQDTRFKHLKERGRVDAPSNGNEFAGRDKRELSVGVSEAIALANEVISNNDLTLEQLKLHAYDIVKEWLEEIYGGVKEA
ncbi:MAG: AAA family ATPase [Thermoproteota archaeon]|nr:AAA family ATPase [Thermoproteota archaeon]MDQ3967026.1 AAA family ATPase [Thermoproteota archaeon]